MAVTEPQVQAAFDATDGVVPPSAARVILVKKLTPLFNGGGTSGTDLGVVHTQSAPATQWGPIAHTFGRRANVYVMDSTGRQTFGEVIEANIGSVIIKFANPKSGSARLS